MGECVGRSCVGLLSVSIHRIVDFLRNVDFVVLDDFDVALKAFQFICLNCVDDHPHFCCMNNCRSLCWHCCVFFEYI